MYYEGAAGRGDAHLRGVGWAPPGTVGAVHLLPADRREIRAATNSCTSAWPVETGRRSGTDQDTFASKLGDHARATRAEVFPTYVFERFVGRHLSDDDWAAIESGQTHMTDHARRYIRTHLASSYRTTTDPAQAVRWEAELRSGALGQRPYINPI